MTEKLSKWKRFMSRKTPEEQVQYHDRRNLMGRYRLTPEQKAAKLAAQGNKCGLCIDEFTEKDYACVDHDHLTKEVRDIIHNSCNLLLGNAKDSIRKLKLAIAYLEKHNDRASIQSGEQVPCGNV